MSDHAIIHNNRKALLSLIAQYGRSTNVIEQIDLFALIEEAIAPPPGATRLILVADDLLEHMGQYTADGGKITMSWGPLMPGGYYEPTFTRHDPEGDKP